MTYLIIDDEPIAHDIIKGYCDLLPNITLAGQCYDAIEALGYLQNHEVDLIFLDLNMPKIKGFDFLKTLSSPPKVIVTTAYKEYALEGYELDVVDYLLKPFSFERFLKAINKIVNLKSMSSQIQTNTHGEDKCIFLYSDKKHVQVKLNDILFVEAAGNYCKVVLKDNQILIREKMSGILEIVPQDKFIRVHKSYIVAKAHILAVEGNRIQIKDHHIPIGKLYKMKVLDFLKS